MAVISTGTVRMHLHRVKDWNNVFHSRNGGLILDLIHAGFDPYILYINMHDITTTTAKSAAPHVTDTEVHPANSKLGLGGGTAVNVILVSDDASDDGIVNVVGWGVNGSEKDTLITEAMTLNGKTNVTSTRKFYEVFWIGANKAVTGNVTLEYPANTTLHTIVAGATTGNGSGFTVPLGWYAKNIKSDIKIGGAVLTRIGWGLTKIEEDDGAGGAADGSNYNVWIHAKAYENDDDIVGCLIHRETATNEQRVEHHLCHEGAAVAANFNAEYVLWKQTVSETTGD